MSKHYETRYQNDFIAKLSDNGIECSEIVFFKGKQIHKADFPARNLGAANRGEYLRCMVASIAAEHNRKSA